MTATTTEPAEPTEAPVRTTTWWREVLVALAFYFVYSKVRNAFGAGPESRQIAFGHAQDVIGIERWFHLFFEPSVQQWYLGLPGHGAIRFWNIYYGTAHFIVTIGVLIVAYRKLPARYRFIRNTLAATTGLALIGFATFTLMPPRLLGATTPYGACYGSTPDCHGYGIVDTLDIWGGSWKFGSGPMAAISNQYAAMPSLHIGWSTWCALTMVLVIGSGWKRWLWFLYPAITFFCIIVTGNHYWLDAFFGLCALAAGTLIAIGIERFWARRDGRDPDEATADLPPHLVDEPHPT
ncbi:MAG: phosphatase PAP2 family protein [Acidimicrobiales bacterium]